MFTHFFLKDKEIGNKKRKGKGKRRKKPNKTVQKTVKRKTKIIAGSFPKTARKLLVASQNRGGSFLSCVPLGQPIYIKQREGVCAAYRMAFNGRIRRRIGFSTRDLCAKQENPPNNKGAGGQFLFSAFSDIYRHIHNLAPPTCPS